MSTECETRAKFEADARLAGYSNFNRERGRYCHVELEVFYQGYLMGGRQVSAAQSAHHCSNCLGVQPESCMFAQSAPAGEREMLQRLLDDIRDVRNADDVAFGWDEAAEYFAAAPAQPAAQDDDLLLELEGLRESLETARHNWRAFEDRCGDLQVENGKLRDRIAAAQDQGEVLTEHSGCGRGIQVDQLTVRMYPGDKVVMVRGRIGKALATSTGQEV